MTLKQVVLSPGFLLKLAALLLISTMSVWWYLLLGTSSKTDPLPGVSLRGQWLWIGYTIPAYLVILPVTLVLYLCERPGLWYHRLLFISGAVSFLTTGIIVLRCVITGASDSPSWQQDAARAWYHPHVFTLVCVVVSILFFVDALENEGVLEYMFLRRGSE